MVISREVKALAWVVVILINLFFVYFSLLRGLERGIEWQRLFLVASLIQLLVELAFYETSECAMVHYYIPNLARKEVQTVGFLLHQAVQSICTDSVSSSPLVLDAPRYLFVSTNLANRFPDLFESVVVKSYHSSSPGELAKKWKVSHASSFVPSLLGSSSTGSRVRRTTVSSLFFSLLQRMGAMPPAIQRLLIHTIQPVIVAGFFMVLVYIHRNPEYLSIVAFLLLVKGYFMYREYKQDKVESTLSVVHPLASSLSGEANIRKRVDRVITPSKIDCEQLDDDKSDGQAVHLSAAAHDGDGDGDGAEEETRPVEEPRLSGALHSPSPEEKSDELALARCTSRRSSGGGSGGGSSRPLSREMIMWASSDDEEEEGGVVFLGTQGWDLCSSDVDSVDFVESVAFQVYEKDQSSSDSDRE
jgi:hypothetical protein